MVDLLPELVPEQGSEVCQSSSDQMYKSNIPCPSNCVKTHVGLLFGLLSETHVQAAYVSPVKSLGCVWSYL